MAKAALVARPALAVCLPFAVFVESNGVGCAIELVGLEAKIKRENKDWTLMLKRSLRLRLLDDCGKFCRNQTLNFILLSNWNRAGNKRRALNKRSAWKIWQKFEIFVMKKKNELFFSDCHLL